MQKISKGIMPVIFDLETTGTDINTANIVQIAAVTAVFQPDGKTKAATLFSSMANPGTPIPKDASNVHGITDADVKWAPSQKRVLQTFAMVLQILELDYDVVLAGQNIERYDVPIIKRVLPGLFDHYPTLDTYTAAMRLFPDKEHKLGPWYEWYLGFQQVDAHDAAADCWMCAHILGKLLLDTGKTMGEMIEWLSGLEVLKKMPFGKYKGMAIEQVPRSYFAWCAQNFHEPPKDLEHTICHVLEGVCE